MSFVREHIIKRVTRSFGWSKLRKAFIKTNPECSACGSLKKREAHHIEDFSTRPELELDRDNLITLCKRCHLLFGHLCSWKSINPTVRQDAFAFHLKVIMRR